MRRNCGSHHDLVTAYHPHRHCGSGILIIWQPCRRENQFVGVAKLDQPPRVEEITPLCFPQTTTTTTTHPYPHSVKLLDQGVFTSIHIRAHDKNYQNREGRVNHRRHATSSTLAVLSRATGVLHVSTHISQAYVLHVHNIWAENIVCVVNNVKRPANMDMVFNYLPDVFALRTHNYSNSWFGETTNEGELTFSSLNVICFIERVRKVAVHL